MSNLFGNAAFLDGAVSWSPFAGCDLAVDDTALGAAGRAVLSALTSTDAVPLGLVSDTAALTSGVLYEVRVLAAAVPDGEQITLDRVGGAGSIAIPRVRIGVAPAARGLADSFDLYAIRTTVPATGTWRLQAFSSTPSVGSRRIAIMKPFLDIARADGLPRPFDPGQHATTDINLPVWPTVLRPFRNPVQIAPVPSRVAFQTSSGIDKTRRLFTEPPVDLRGQIRCTSAEMDALQTFHDAGHDRFWVVRPDTDQLCVASWKPDGMPKPVEFRGPTTIVEVGLQVSIA